MGWGRLGHDRSSQPWFCVTRKEATWGKDFRFYGEAGHPQSQIQACVTMKIMKEDAGGMRKLETTGQVRSFSMLKGFFLTCV